jgi:hypothetical protein
MLKRHEDVTVRKKQQWNKLPKKKTEKVDKGKSRQSKHASNKGFSD